MHLNAINMVSLDSALNSLQSRAKKKLCKTFMTTLRFLVVAKTRPGPEVAKTRPRPNFFW